MPEKMLLAINSPAHASVLLPGMGADSVNTNLNGSVLSSNHGGIALHHRWYSSLAAEIASSQVTTANLRVGSHVVTYSASDQDDHPEPPQPPATIYAAVEFMGYAGGKPLAAADPDNPSPCVVHVLVANMLSPETSAVSRSAMDLRAEVPLQWANPANPSENDATYHEQNKLRYRWRFHNLSNSGPADILIEEDQLQFHPSDGDNEFAWLGYNGAINSLIVGDSYLLTLRVEHLDNPAQAHESTLNITVEA